MSEHSLRNHDGKYCNTPCFYRPHRILTKKSLNAYNLYFHILIIIHDNLKFLNDN